MENTQQLKLTRESLGKYQKSLNNTENNKNIVGALSREELRSDSRFFLMP